MAKTTTTRKTSKKATTKRTAGRAKAAAELIAVPRRAVDLAAAIQRRMKRSPRYWSEVLSAMDTAATPRVAQDMPREHATH